MRCDLAALKPMTDALPDLQRARLARGGCSAATDAARGSRSPGRAGPARRRPRDAQIAAIGLVIDMLELAPAAFRENGGMAATGGAARVERAIVEQHVAGNAKRHMSAARGDAIAARRDPDDRFAHRPVRAPAGWPAQDRRRSSPGPAISAARPCSHTAAQAASNGVRPARPQRGDHAGEHVARSRGRQPGRRGLEQAQPPVRRGHERVRPLEDDDRARPPAASSARSAFCPPARRTAASNSPSCGVRIASWPSSRSGLADLRDARRHRSPWAHVRSAPASAPAECRPARARPGGSRCARR